jgi:hypothetical protein
VLRYGKIIYCHTLRKAKMNFTPEAAVKIEH